MEAPERGEDPRIPGNEQGPLARDQGARVYCGNLTPPAWGRMPEPDPTQIDNPYLDKDSNALTFIVGKMREYSVFGHVFLERTERSELAAIAAEIL